MMQLNSLESTVKKNENLWSETDANIYAGKCFRVQKSYAASDIFVVVVVINSGFFK